MGPKGEVGKCPNGYNSIHNHNMCKQASSNLTLFYSKESGDGKEDSICNLCGNCKPNLSRMKNDFGKQGKTICVDEDQGTLNTIFNCPFMSEMLYFVSFQLQIKILCISMVLVCDWQCYLDRYLDLQDLFGKNNVLAAQNHWNEHGRKEARDCSCGNVNDRYKVKKCKMIDTCDLVL